MRGVGSPSSFLVGGLSLRREQAKRHDLSHHYLFQVGCLSSRDGSSPFCHPVPLGKSVTHSRCMSVVVGGTDEE